MSLNCNYILDAELWLQLNDRTDITILSVYISRLSDGLSENTRVHLS